MVANDRRWASRTTNSSRSSSKKLDLKVLLRAQSDKDAAQAAKAYFSGPAIVFNFDPGDGTSHHFVLDHEGNEVLHVQVDPAHWRTETATEWRLSHSVKDLAAMFITAIGLHLPAP
jgi:hypothetical protein